MRQRAARARWMANARGASADSASCYGTRQARRAAEEVRRARAGSRILQEFECTAAPHSAQVSLVAPAVWTGRLDFLTCAPAPPTGYAQRAHKPSGESSAPKEQRSVATGETRGEMERFDLAPAGAKIGLLQDAHSFAPRGAMFVLHAIHGFHPWLHSCAPLGLHRRAAFSAGVVGCPPAHRIRTAGTQAALDAPPAADCKRHHENHPKNRSVEDRVDREAGRHDPKGQHLDFRKNMRVY